MTSEAQATGAGGRVGLIVPPANPIAEAEIPALVPRVTQFHVARFAPVDDPDLLARIRGYDADVGRAATSFGTLRLDAVVLAFAATSFLRGPAGEEGLAAELRAGRDVPVVNAATAVRARLADLGRDRIVVVSPYPTAVHDLALAYWAAAGIEVVADVRVAPPDGSIYGIPSGRVAEALAGRRLGAGEAVVLSGTGLETMDRLWRLRGAVGGPVVSYNAAIAAWVTRHVGPLADA